MSKSLGLNDSLESMVSRSEAKWLAQHSWDTSVFVLSAKSTKLSDFDVAILLRDQPAGSFNSDFDEVTAKESGGGCKPPSNC